MEMEGNTQFSVRSLAAVVYSAARAGPGGLELEFYYNSTKAHNTTHTHMGTCILLLLPF